MKKGLIFLSCAVLTACGGGSNDGTGYANGKYSADGLNLDGTITATVTIKGHKIASVAVKDNGHTYSQFTQPFKLIPERVVEQQTADVDGVSGATFTSDAVKEAVREALAQASGEKAEGKGEITYTPGTYTGNGRGYGGPLQAIVTFSENGITDITVGQQRETAHVGDVAFPILIPDIKAANGIGVDGVSGATFSGHALKAAVLDAAKQAGVTNRTAFMNNTVVKKAGETIEDTWDVVIIGGGGAGLCAGAQAAQDGNTVLVIEKNAELGGNTLVSGGIYQSVDHSLVWDPAKPEAYSAIGFDGQRHKKVHSTIGCMSDLETILNWSEEPFDEEFYKTHEFVAGDIAELSKHGVHAEFLPTLKALKKEIEAYIHYEMPYIRRGMAENELIQFSTTNLHIFQTYYGGLRQDVSKNEWVHGDFELIKQFVEEGEQLKPWLMDMGVDFTDSQSTLVGALWYRGNTMTGCRADADGDGSAEFYQGNWGSYVMAPVSVINNANEHNTIMKRTSAGELIFENGRVTGVKAVKSDGTQVIAHARKGVIIATGGYAANIQKVLRTNKYWSRQYLSPTIGTTNRSSLRGDGIDMAQKLGAATVGEGYTQLLPLAYMDGSIAFGGVESAVFISPKTGKRYIDECSERDVLSINAFKHGVEKDGVRGVFIYITRGFGVGYAGMGAFGGDNPGKEWGRKGSQLGELFAEIGLDVDVEKVKQTIKNYDMAIMEGRQPEDVGKGHPIDIIGTATKVNGVYDPSTYSLDDADLRIRLLAPSTHHTMGGLKIDLDRRVLDGNGKPIPGLYAAGEVTGGFFGGNRLGGNALTEVMASGRIAARGVQKDN